VEDWMEEDLRAEHRLHHALDVPVSHADLEFLKTSI
jgi:hypothetical protein